MISVKEIHKSFGKQKILSGVSFEIEAGETLCVLGKSGTGKSVLIKIITNLLEQDSGEILVDGENHHQNSLKQQELMEKIGFVFQGAALFDSLSVYENIGLRLIEQKKLSAKNIREKVAHALENVGLAAETMTKLPAELSGGMKKRVGIARAIVHEPKYIFYDEPTTGLDPINADKIDELILNLSKDSARTSVIVTHDLFSVEKFANKIVLLDNGTIQFQGTQDGFRKSQTEIVQNFIQRSQWR